jgi:hypothetical protein
MPPIRCVSLLIALAVGATPATVASQAPHGRGAGSRAVVAPPEASQFDCLVGEWELVVVPKVSGLAARIHGAPKLLGTWTASRSFDGFGIQDELRIVDGSGNPSSLSHTMRVYDAAAKRWDSATLDVYRARFSTGSGQLAGGEMVMTATGTDTDGKSYLSRTRFHSIRRDSFILQQDRSMDRGRTWNEKVLRIEAKRAAAAPAR